MYDVARIAEYIVNYSNEKGYGISNLKLQKVLYFVQGIFLREYGKVCFYEPIEAWDYGPVVPVAYRIYKHYGSTDIFSISFDGDVLQLFKKDTYANFNIKEEHKLLIKKVVDLLSEYDALELVEITHKQAPWKDSYIRGFNNEINVETIRRFFKDR